MTLLDTITTPASLLDSSWAQGAPLIVNYGAGVDSTAMLLGFIKLGIVPDLVMFADTGIEKPETYAYLDTMDAHLVANGFPTITRVMRPHSRPSKTGPGYATLEGNALQNDTLPSLAFGGKSCSLKWKAEPMDAWIRGKRLGNGETWAPAAAAWSKGLRPVKCIGYDNGPADSRRATNRTEDDAEKLKGSEKGKPFSYRYPLRDWGWAREQCVEAIIEAGLPLPLKSACFMCPASKPAEVLWLAAAHPEHFLRSIFVEDNAVTAGNLKSTTVGLGRKWSWRAKAESLGILEVGELRFAMSLEERVELAAANPVGIPGGCAFVLPETAVEV